jgi:hypothetical protein
MAVTYYVALPFIHTEDGTAPGEAQECQSEGAAIRQAEEMSRDPAHAGVAHPILGGLQFSEVTGRLDLAGAFVPIATNQSLMAPYTNCLTSLR